MIIFHLSLSTFHFFYIIIIHFNAKYHQTANCGNQIGDKQGPENLWIVQNALKHKADAANSTHQKCRQGNIVCLARAERVYRLWHIAEYQTNAGHPSANLINYILFHSIFVFMINNSFLILIIRISVLSV